MAIKLDWKAKRVELTLWGIIAMTSQSTTIKAIIWKEDDMFKDAILGITTQGERERLRG